MAKRQRSSHTQPYPLAQQPDENTYRNKVDAKRSNPDKQGYQDLPDIDDSRPGSIPDGSNAPGICVRRGSQDNTYRLESNSNGVKGNLSFKRVKACLDVIDPTLNLGQLLFNT